MTKLTRDLGLPVIGGRLEAEYGMNFRDSDWTRREKEFFWQIFFGMAGPDARYNAAIGWLQAGEVPELVAALRDVEARIRTLNGKSITANYEEHLGTVGPLDLSIERKEGGLRLRVGMRTSTNFFSRYLDNEQVLHCVQLLGLVSQQGNALLNELRELVCEHKETFSAATVEEAKKLAEAEKCRHPGLAYVLGEAAMGQPMSFRGTGRTEALALENALSQVPRGATVAWGPRTVALSTSGESEVQSDSASEVEAEVLKREQGRTLVSVTCVEEGKKGFIGLGKRKAKWRVAWMSPFVVELGCDPIASVTGYWCKK